jgi:hypothetical protein
VSKQVINDTMPRVAQHYVVSNATINVQVFNGVADIDAPSENNTVNLNAIHTWVFDNGMNDQIFIHEQFGTATGTANGNHWRVTASAPNANINDLGSGGALDVTATGGASTIDTGNNTAHLTIGGSGNNVLTRGVATLDARNSTGGNTFRLEGSRTSLTLGSGSDTVQLGPDNQVVRLDHFDIKSDILDLSLLGPNLTVLQGGHDVLVAQGYGGSATIKGLDLGNMNLATAEQTGIIKTV